MGEGYDVAQICLNGHKINSSSRRLPEFNQTFCDKCGGKTITECPSCATPIRGYFAGSMSITYDVHEHCYQCGKAFPWTEGKKAAALELFLLESDAEPEAATEFEKDLDDIVRGTPRAPVAASRFKRALAKVGKPAADGIRDIIIDIVSEAAKKIVWP
jgi:hypothetical protein